MADKNKLRGAQIKDYFERQGIPQTEVAKRLGVTAPTVSQLINGKPFGEKSAERWHEVFGFNPLWLRFGIGTMFGDEPSSISQSIIDNSGVAIQQAGSNSNSQASESFFTRLCADLMKQIMERDEKICCLEKEIADLKSK